MSTVGQTFADRFKTHVADRFKDDTAHHVMTILLDQGLYRHICFRAPSNSHYWFDLVTWPDNLTIRGDMGCFTFSRLQDMFDFFRGDRINPQYWAEKVQSGRAETERYMPELFREQVLDHIAEYAVEYPGLAKEVEEDIFGWDCSNEQDARERLSAFEHKNFRFVDVWEWSFHHYSYQYLWDCHAIQWGVNTYTAAGAGS